MSTRTLMQTYKVTVNKYKTICWYNEKNQLHRLNGPAIEWADGTKEWWVDDKCHRLDGPAVEWASGFKAWWVKGKQMTEEEFNKYIRKPTCEGKIVEVDGVKYRLVKAEEADQ